MAHGAFQRQWISNLAAALFLDRRYPIALLELDSLAKRVRSVPKASRRRGARTFPAPAQPRERESLRDDGRRLRRFPLRSVRYVFAPPQLFDQPLPRAGSQRRWLHRWSGPRSPGGSTPAVGQGLGPADIVPLIKPFDSCGAGSLEVGQTRPAAQKVQRERAVELFAHQFQGLGIIAFEDTAQFVGQLGAMVGRRRASDKPASWRVATSSVGKGRSRWRWLRSKSSSTRASGMSSLAPEGRRPPASTGAGGRMDREEDQPGDIHQQMHQGTLAGFQRQGDRPALEALVELLDPSADQFRGMGEGGGFGGLGTGVPQRHGVLAVAPIQPDEGRKFGSDRLGIFVHEG